MVAMLIGKSVFCLGYFAHKIKQKLACGRNCARAVRAKSPHVRASSHHPGGEAAAANAGQRARKLARGAP